MWIQFYLENFHFAANLFAALTFFAVFWLYLDAWHVQRSRALLLRISGFLIISVSFLIHALYIESSILSVSLLGASTIQTLSSVTRILGFIFVIASQLTEPLQARPDYKERTVHNAGFVPFGVSGVLPLAVSFTLHPILAATTGLLYLRRATVGLEHHLKPVAGAFILFGISELLALLSLLGNSLNFRIYEVVSAFGPVWIAEHLILVAAVSMLARWVFGYLLKQFQTQLFMIFTSVILLIFLVTTGAFTALLVKNIQDESTNQLETNVKVLNYVLDAKASQVVSDAQMVAANPLIVQGILDTSKKTLGTLVEQILLTKNESSLLILGESGNVLARGEDRERIGDSLSSDPLVRRALAGSSVSSFITTDGVLAPSVSVRAAVPVKSADSVIGVVFAGSAIDSAFVDGMKRATGLEAVIYGGNQISASTLVSADGKTRITGIKEENRAVKETVLVKGNSFVGSVSFMNLPYFAAFQPITDADGNPVGMLEVAKPQHAVLTAAGRSIELTFLVTVGLLVCSVFFSYSIARYIAMQL